jgi:RNA polymerase sigma-70 factor (ECF subfamily)
MPEDRTFQDLIHQVRAGNQEAATELVRLYEPTLRRLIRIRLQDSQLRHVIDSMDVCQSVMANFFVGAALGRFPELDTPQQLIKLLSSMSRHELINQAKKHRADRRDYRRVEGGDFEERQVASSDPTPSWQISAQELIQEVLRRLSPENQQLLRLRQEGRGWEEIAAAVGGSPEALRKQLARAVHKLGFEDLYEE